MKRYTIALLSRLIPLVCCCLLTGYLVAIDWYGIAVIAFGVACWFIFALFRFMRRTVKDAKRLIDAIHFSELNISFRNFVYFCVVSFYEAYCERC